MDIEYSENLKKNPEYAFVEISKKKKALAEKGADIVDLGIGDPDLPTPDGIRDAMKKAVDDPDTIGYPMDAGRLDLREAWIKWSKKRFGLNLKLEQTQVLNGSKEGLCNLARGFDDHGLGQDLAGRVIGVALTEGFLLMDGMDDIHAASDLPERGEALAVRVTHAAKVQRRLCADTNEECRAAARPRVRTRE